MALPLFLPCAAGVEALLAEEVGRILPGLADAGRANPSLSTDHPAARLLQGYAAALLGHEGALPEADQALYAGHIADLVALLLGPTRDAAEQARTGGARAHDERGDVIRAGDGAGVGVAVLGVRGEVRRIPRRKLDHPARVRTARVRTARVRSAGDGQPERPGLDRDVLV